jgi:hypothetical protein
MTDLEKKELNDMLDTFKAGLPSAITKEQLDAEIKGLETRLASQFEQKDYSKDFEQMKTAIKAIEQKAGRQTEKNGNTIADSIVSMFEEKGLKSLADLEAVKGKEIELKADNPLINTSLTGDFSRTQVAADLRFAPLRPTAFIGKGITVGTLAEGKNILLWTVGSRTQNVAYSGELSDNLTGVDGSTLTATEKTRKLSKVVGRAVVSQEAFADIPQLAQRVQMNLMDGITLFLDEKILTGAGNDSTKPTEMYGLKTGQMTAFNSALIPKVQKPNVADLADACKLQAKLSYQTVDTVWMSDALAFKLQRTKDTTGQYIINKLIDGTMVMGGLRVETTELLGGVAAEEMIVGRKASIQLWIKQNLSAEFERVAKSDSWNLYVYARQQMLVEDEDIKSLIYVDNVATALELIEEATVVAGE